MKKNFGLLALFTFASLTFISCDDNNDANTPYDETLSGGDLTIFDISEKAFDRPAPNRASEDDFKFISGNAFFRRHWVFAPSTTEGNDGLGPLFNARSCTGCHQKDGRGKIPNEGENIESILFRLSMGNDPINGPIPDPNYGTQFNHLSHPEVMPEGSVQISYEYFEGNYPDGEKFQLRKPIIQFIDLAYGSLYINEISPRVAPFMIGLGLLEAIDENEILSREDEADLNRDGISGRANFVFDKVNNRTSLGRFGWKANKPNLKQQVAGAFIGDIGMTTSLFPDENCGSNQPACQEAYSGGEPELSDIKLDEVTFYSSMIAVPARRNVDLKNVQLGKSLFFQTGCNSCHVETYVTGKHDIKALENQRIFPYTDLLLHDMGEELADNREDFLANGKEWRTPPLWGIGLIETVNNHNNLLHDGRARGFEEAILWHGGEAEVAKAKFMELSKTNRSALLEFLGSL